MGGSWAWRGGGAGGKALANGDEGLGVLSYLCKYLIDLM